MEEEKRQLEMKWSNLQVTSKQQMEALSATWAIEKQQWQAEKMTLEGEGVMASRSYEQERRLLEERYTSEKLTVQRECERECADALARRAKESEKERETLEHRLLEVVNERDQYISERDQCMMECDQYACLLETTKRQALEDHARDTEALAEMNRKFDALMLGYQTNKSSSSWSSPLPSSSSSSSSSSAAASSSSSADGNKLDDDYQLNQIDSSRNDMIQSNISMDPLKSPVKSPFKFPAESPVKSAHAHEMITAQQMTIQSLGK